MACHDEFIRFLASNSIIATEDDNVQIQPMSAEDEQAEFEAFLNSDCWPAQPVASSSGEPTSPNPQNATSSYVGIDDKVDVMVHNVVAAFNVRCPLDLRQIASKGNNVIYRTHLGKVDMKLRKPRAHINIWPQGNISCFGAASAESAKKACRKVARILAKMNYPVRFCNYRIVNVLGSCCLPWTIKIPEFAQNYRNEAIYEPELHTGVSYKMVSPKATLRLFTTGSITVTATSENDVHEAIRKMYELVFEFRNERTPSERRQLILKRLEIAHGRRQTIGKLLAELNSVDEAIRLEESIMPSRLKQATTTQSVKPHVAVGPDVNVKQKALVEKAVSTYSHARFKAFENWGKIQSSEEKSARNPFKAEPTRKGSSSTSTAKRSLEKRNKQGCSNITVDEIPTRISSFARRLKPTSKRALMDNL